ncbi:MAG: cadherin-like beta sandwich domain-containing protein [Clostridiales bacterium]|nr:MAG: cadherin-like beta sandwich domain-containing protein [Clostridiales bacterium]
MFVSGDNAGTYYYTVNYFRNQITVKPTAKGADIKVNGETVASGKVSNPINLEVGNNEIKKSKLRSAEIPKHTRLLSAEKQSL